MAITRTAQGTAISGSSPVTIASVSVLAGETLFVFWGAQAATACTFNGNSMTKDVEGAGTTAIAGIYRWKNTTGSTVTGTISWTGTPNVTIAASTWTGLDDVSVDKTSSGFSAGSTAVDSGATATTAQASELVLGAVCLGNNSTASYTTWNDAGGGVGLTKGQVDTTASGGAASNRGVCEGYLEVSATGTYKAAMTLSPSRRWSAAVATYTITGAAAGSRPPAGRLSLQAVSTAASR